MALSLKFTNLLYAGSRNSSRKLAILTTLKLVRKWDIYSGLKTDIAM
jgi:hypothetical protein